MTKFSNNNINYKVLDDTLKTCCVGYGESETQTALIDTTVSFVKIPSSVEDPNTNIIYTVTIISQYTFWHSKIETVIVPFTVKEIKHAAFANSKSLVNVIFEPGIDLKYIDFRFLFYTNVSMIVLPPNLSYENINSGAFDSAINIKKIIYCGNNKFPGLSFSSSNVKVYVPNNYKYSMFGGKPIVKTSHCSLIHLVTICAKRKSVFSSILFMILLISYK